MIAHYSFLTAARGTLFPSISAFGWLAWAVAFGSQMTSSAIPAITAIILGFVCYIVFYLVFDVALNLHKGKDLDKITAEQGEIWIIPTAADVTEGMDAEAKLCFRQVAWRCYDNHPKPRAFSPWFFLSRNPREDCAMKQIRFGLGIATGTEGLMYPIPYSSAREVVEISVLAERLGFDSVWGNDHIQTQEYVYEKFGDYPRYYAPLMQLAAIAEHTTSLLLCTALLLLPFRHPVNIAKEVATLDHLSGGRVRLGVGIGAYREEFEAQYGRMLPMLTGARC